MAKGIVVGIGLTLLAFLCGGLVIVELGLIPANADGRPPFVEKWIARHSLHATIDREAPKGPNPQALDDANLLAGIKVYAADCAVCHGAADGKPSPIATGLYQHAPQLAKHGVTDDPAGETYWKVYHGIRMTGMPSFRRGLTEQEMWQVTLFLQHMNELSPAAKKAWAAVPSQGLQTR